MSAEISAEGAKPGTAAGDFFSLTKPSLSLLVLFTSAGGLWLSSEQMPLSRWLLVMLATAGTVGAANAFNCVIERDSDRFMARTAKRPLPAGRMDWVVALLFAVSLAVTSLPALAFGANLLTAALGLIALLLYVAVYTPMKRRTHWAMVVGAIPGAMPPLMGWTAATGEVSAPGLVLFGILFFWQLPHFLAIALFRKPEYRKAGLASVPLELGDDVARAHALVYLLMLFVVGLLPWALGVANGVYLAVAVLLGGAFLGWGAVGFFTRAGPAWARQLFLLSLLHLSGLFAALALCAVR